MARAAVPTSNLLDLVRCELCLEKYNDSDRLPKLLNCSHTFCLACVQGYYESKLKNKLTCPNCRTEFTVPRGGVQNLSTNIMVVNFVDHLAPFAAVDTDEGVVEATFVPKDKIPEEPGSTACGMHPREKCDFYCDDCRDPLCADCIVSITKGPHKTHNIRKLRDVLTTYSTQHKDTLQLITIMKMEGKQRTEELLEELIQSRDSLMKKAKSKHDKAHQEADRWYQNTTATISKAYDKLHAQILQFISKIDLQELQESLEKIDLLKIDGDLKQAQSSLDELQSSVTSFKQSTVWPAKFWSVDVGKITDDFTVDLGSTTEPTLKVPDVSSFPYTIKKKHSNAEVAKPNVRKETQQQPGFRHLSDLPMQPACHWSVGMTTNEAVVCFDGQSIIKKIAFESSQVIDLYQKQLPGKLDLNCMKYILNNNYVLLRERGTGPSYILNSQLELVSTIQEDYGLIIGAESTHWVAFYKYPNIIRIYDLEQKQLLQKLTRPDEVKWSVDLSICRHLDSQRIAVVDCNSNNLCIYNHDGSYRFLKIHRLRFMPDTIACNRRHLYVASYNEHSIFVFSWNGQLVTKLDTQQLRIPKGQWIHNIAVDEDQFTIAVGDCIAFGPRWSPTNVSSFKTFQGV